MHHQRSEIDRRSVRVRLTEKGRRVRGQMSELFGRHTEVLAKRGVIDAEVMETINSSLKRMERFWTEQIRYIY
jgi:DNA-binding MarR family transcriptional regulator